MLGFLRDLRVIRGEIFFPYFLEMFFNHKITKHEKASCSGNKANSGREDQDRLRA